MVAALLNAKQAPSNRADKIFTDDLSFLPLVHTSQRDIIDVGHPSIDVLSIHTA